MNKGARGTQIGDIELAGRVKPHDLYVVEVGIRPRLYMTTTVSVCAMGMHFVLNAAERDVGQSVGLEARTAALSE